MIRIAIIQFPGSNCERETALAVKRAGMVPEDFFWNQSPERLADYDGFILVGGFSYEDRSRAGIIAAMDPILQGISLQAASGKPVLGICNGAQILVEAGLVPGLENNQTALALTDNQRIQNERIIGTGFYNAWVHMRLADDEPWTAFTQNLTAKDIMKIPVAHAEGRFVISQVLLAEMQHQGMRIFQYCNATGTTLDSFPTNPNGSIDNIAAISNRAGNVMAMMPHPERTPAGDPIFYSMKKYIERGHVQKVRPLRYLPRAAIRQPYCLPEGHYECLVGLKVTDNQAASVENIFKHQGMQVRIHRYTHWEIACNSELDLKKMQATGFLWNERKEYLLNTFVGKGLLVQAKEDFLGKKILQQFHEHFGIAHVKDIRHGVLWQVETDTADIDNVLHSPIFYNPFSHVAWAYK